MVQIDPSRAASSDEAAYIRNRLHQVKQLNFGWLVAYALVGIALMGSGGLFFYKAADNTAFYFVGGIFILLSLPFNIGIVFSIIERKGQKTPQDNTPIRIYQHSGPVDVRVIHRAKGGPEYRFYLNNRRLYLPNPVYESVFRQLDKKKLTLSVCKVPLKYRSISNIGEPEYLVVGVNGYMECINKDSVVYSMPIKRISLIWTLLIMVTIFGFVLYQEEGIEIVPKIFPPHIFTGVLQYFPHMLFGFYLLSVGAMLAATIIGGIRCHRAASKIETAIRKVIHFEF